MKQFYVDSLIMMFKFTYTFVVYSTVNLVSHGQTQLVAKGLAMQVLLSTWQFVAESIHE